MKVNNQKEIRTLLEFSNPDHFYQIQIIKRRKDNPDMKKPQQVLRSFIISSYGEYDDILERKIIPYCQDKRARAYFDLNPKSHRKCGHKTINEISNNLYSEEFYKIEGAYYRVMGKSNAEDVNGKKWIIDIDIKDERPLDDIIGIINPLYDQINERKEKDYQIHQVLSTNNGYHIICNPFDISEFNKQRYKVSNDEGKPLNDKEFQIHHEGITVLFHP